MRKQVLLDDTMPYFKANMHCHTTNSDGKMTPEQIKARYTEGGYHIVAFTDHEHLIDNSHLNDEHFLAITACELAIRQFPGISSGVMRDMKVCHLNLFARDPHNVDTPCYNSVADHFINESIRDKIVHTSGEYERVYSHEGISNIIAQANRRGFLVAYNHPAWSLEDARDYLGYEGLWALEVYNHSSFCSGYFDYDIQAYDHFLRDGKRIGCIMGDDNHSFAQTLGSATYFNAPSLGYDEIFDAMEHHRFYCSTGPLIHRLEIGKHAAHIVFSGADKVIMTPRGRGVKLVCFEDEGLHEARIPISSGDTYVRFDAVDRLGRRAHTCAYFLDELS